MATTAFATLYARLFGAILLLIGLAGVIGLPLGYIGFYRLDVFTLDYTLSVVHLILGLVGVYAGFASRPSLSPITYGKATGVLLLLLGLVGFYSRNVVGIGPSLGLSLELGENVIHVIVGVLGLLAGFYVVEPEETVTSGPGPYTGTA